MREQEIPEGYSIAVLHAHTNKSDGVVTPSRLVEEAARNDVRVLAITDHDTMAGVKEAQKRGPALGVEVIAGEEITTGLFRPKHIIGLHLQKPVQSLKPYKWTIKEIKKQGGLVIIPHPLDGHTALQEKEIQDLLQTHPIDGIEAVNGQSNNILQNRLEILLAKLEDKVGALLGASDCHFGHQDLLSAYTLFPGKGLQDFLQALKDKTTRPIQGPNPQISLAQRIKQHFQAIVILGIRRYFLRNLS